MDFDDILPDIGEFGKYQKLMITLVLLPCLMPCGFHAYNQLFMAAAPDHWCQVPALMKFNLTVEQRKKLSVPLEEKDGEWAYSNCRMFDVNFSAILNQDSEMLPLNTSVLWNPNPNWPTSRCRYGWEYDFSQYSSTVVTDWDIVCEKNWYPTLALVLFSVGGLVGNYIFGYLQDGIGRRLSFFLYLLVECVFGVATAFAPNFISWTICRVGVGFTVPAIMGTPFVLAIELVGASKRTLTTILTNIWYSVTLVILAGVVYAIRDWTQLALATTLPFATFLFYWWVLPESPRWLLAHGKFEEAEKIICKIARVNGKSLPPDYMVTLKRRFKVESAVKEMEDKNRQIYGVSDLFRSPNMIKKTLVITFLWFTNTSVYVGLSYYAPILGGNEYLNFFLAGVAELPTYFFLWPSMEYWGRRWTICASMVIGGISCLATFLVRHNQAATLFLYCVGKFGISSSFVALPLMGMELYPTVVRGLGLGFSSMAGMIGPILIPFINYLGEEFLVLPLMIMGGLLTVGGLSALILPETLNQHLPQTLEDGEEFGKDWELKDYLQCCPAKSSSIDGSIKEEEEDEDRAESPLRSLLECQETLSLQNELLSERGSTADEGPLEEAVRVTVL